MPTHNQERRNSLSHEGLLSMLSFSLKIAAGSQLEKATFTIQMIRACRGIVPKRIGEARVLVVESEGSV
jgi:hypothetical protein